MYIMFVISHIISLKIIFYLEAKKKYTIISRGRGKKKYVVGKQNKFFFFLLKKIMNLLKKLMYNFTTVNNYIFIFYYYYRFIDIYIYRPFYRSKKKIFILRILFFLQDKITTELKKNIIILYK